MIKFVKTLLYKLLGRDKYLLCLHYCFFILFDLGFLKSDTVYKYHYFVKHLIKPGDVVLDIGANLGYYSRIFNRLVGNTGKVYSVEPVPVFYKVLQYMLGGKPNAVLHHTALGTSKQNTTIVLPQDTGYFRTGLANISNNTQAESNSIKYEVPMNKGSELFATLNTINYIKMDIEGYEEFVLPEMKTIIMQHLPLIQVETWGEQKKVVFDLLQGIGYTQYTLYNGKLVKQLDPAHEFGDYLFVHSSKEQAILAQLHSKNLA
jgi:FkbM family methyltransferase